MEWARILAYITGTVDQELLLRNEYLVAENRLLKSQLKGRLKLSDVERTKLGEIGHRLGRKALGEVAATALPDTILAWYRRLIAGSGDTCWLSGRCPAEANCIAFAGRGPPRTTSGGREGSKSAGARQERPSARSTNSTPC